MSRESVIFLLSVATLLMPHFGVPEAWKFYFYTGAGVIGMVCAYSLRRTHYIRSIERNGERNADSFAEQGGPRGRLNTETPIQS